MGCIRRHSRRDTKGGKEGSRARKRGKSQTLYEAGLTAQGSMEGMGGQHVFCWARSRRSLKVTVETSDVNPSE